MSKLSIHLYFTDIWIIYCSKHNFILFLHQMQREFWEIWRRNLRSDLQICIYYFWHIPYWFIDWLIDFCDENILHENIYWIENMQNNIINYSQYDFSYSPILLSPAPHNTILLSALVTNLKCSLWLSYLL